MRMHNTYLPLELLDGAHLDIRQVGLQEETSYFTHLGVVGGNDADFGRG